MNGKSTYQTQIYCTYFCKFLTSRPLINFFFIPKRMVDFIRITTILFRSCYEINPPLLALYLNEFLTRHENYL